MNLKIILKDPKHCDGCRLIQTFWKHTELSTGYEKMIEYWCCNWYLDLGKKWNENIIRPKKCIKENGE